MPTRSWTWIEVLRFSDDTAPQDYFTYAKVFALLIICNTGFVQLARGRTEYFTWADTETVSNVQ